MRLGGLMKHMDTFWSNTHNIKKQRPQSLKASAGVCAFRCGPRGHLALS